MYCCRHSHMPKHKRTQKHYTHHFSSNPSRFSSKLQMNMGRCWERTWDITTPVLRMSIYIIYIFFFIQASVWSNKSPSFPISTVSRSNIARQQCPDYVVLFYAEIADVWNCMFAGCRQTQLLFPENVRPKMMHSAMLCSRLLLLSCRFCFFFFKLHVTSM